MIRGSELDEQDSEKENGEEPDAGEPGEDAGLGEPREIWAEAAHLVARATELLKQRSGWTRRALARDRHSHLVSPSSERAVRFCASGALLRAYSERSGVPIRIVREGEKELFRPPAALRLAYTMVAYHLAFFLPQRSAIILGVKERGGTSQLQLTIPGKASKSGRRRTLTLSARRLLEELNDLRALKHEDIRLGLMLSQIALTTPERGGGDGGDEA